MPPVHFVNFRPAGRARLIAEEHALLNVLLSLWLLLGIAIWLLLPAARGYSVALGWSSYWLLVAPALPLALLHRRWLSKRVLNGATALQRAILVRSQRRRRFSVQAVPARRAIAVPALKRAA